MTARVDRVLVLDDDVDFCELLGDFLEATLEIDHLAVHSVGELVSRAEEALACACAVLDVNLGPGLPSGIDAFEWLRSRGFRGRIVFLTGHARDHSVLRDLQRTGVTVLTKPVSSETLLSLLAWREEPPSVTTART